MLQVTPTSTFGQKCCHFMRQRLLFTRLVISYIEVFSVGDVADNPVDRGDGKFMKVETSSLGEVVYVFVNL